MQDFNSSVTTWYHDNFMEAFAKTQICTPKYDFYAYLWEYWKLPRSRDSRESGVATQFPAQGRDSEAVRLPVHATTMKWKD